VNWFSVKDQLPPVKPGSTESVKYSDSVLVFEAGEIYIAWRRQLAETDGDGNVVNWDAEPEWATDGQSPKRITHWMPLPKLPS
jgi:hypothetical protein